MSPARLASLAASLLALLGTSPALAGAPCRAIDLMPAYDRFVATTASLPPDQQAALFLRDFVPRYSGFYLIGGITRPEELADPARAYFARTSDFPGMRPFSAERLASYAAIVARDFPDYQRRFLQAFPGFDCHTDVVFGVALGRFNGTAVQGANRTYLLFGLDVISRVETPERLPMLIQHELFHLYHRQLMPAGAALDPMPVWWGIWAEGLATFVSSQLNPAVPADAIYGFPPNLGAQVAPHRRELAARLLAAIDATGPGYTPFFTANESPPGLPPRAGYWFGTELVRRLAATHDVVELARMQPGAVRALVLAYLREEAGARP